MLPLARESSQPAVAGRAAHAEADVAPFQDDLAVSAASTEECSFLVLYPDLRKLLIYGACAIKETHEL